MCRFPVHEFWTLLFPVHEFQINGFPACIITGVCDIGYGESVCIGLSFFLYNAVCVFVFIDRSVLYECEESRRRVIM